MYKYNQKKEKWYHKENEKCKTTKKKVVFFIELETKIVFITHKTGLQYL